MTNELVEVPFHGKVIKAIPHQGDVFSPFKDLCETIGLDFSSQLRRLKRKSWAVMVMMAITGPDRKVYETMCLRRDRIPMWLATIDLGRVDDGVRRWVTLFQEEAAEALADHFLGRRGQALPDAVLRDLVEMLTDRVADQVTPILQARISELLPPTPEPRWSLRRRCELLGWQCVTRRDLDAIRRQAYVEFDYQGLPRPVPVGEAAGCELQVLDRHAGILDPIIMRVWQDSDRRRREAERRRGRPLFDDQDRPPNGFREM